MMTITIIGTCNGLTDHLSETWACFWHVDNEECSVEIFASSVIALVRTYFSHLPGHGQCVTLYLSRPFVVDT